MSRMIESCVDAVRRSPGCQQSLQALAAALQQEQQLGQMARRALESAREELGIQGEWKTALALAELELVYTAEREHQADLVVYSARVLHEELLDQDAAIAAYQRAVELRPDDPKLKDSLETILLVRGKWQQVADRYVEEAESSSNKGLATTLFLSAAELVWRNDSEEPRIEHWLRKSLQVEPRNRKAGAHLERLYRERGRSEELTELLVDRAALAVSRADRVAASLKLGQIWASRGLAADGTGRKGKGKRGAGPSAKECRSRAVDHYRKVLALDPTNETALEFVAEILLDKREWAALVRLYEDALAAQPPAVQSVSRLALVADLYAEKLQQPGKAEAYYRRVRNLDPAHQSMTEFYRARYVERGETAKLMSLLESAQRAETDAVRRVALAEQTAQLAEYELHNIDKAIDVWKGLLHSGTHQTSAQAIVALKRLYRKATPPKWNALRELLKEQIAALADSQVEEKIWLLLETVEIYRDHLGLEVAAISTYKEILTYKPDHTEALDALVGHYEGLGRWTDLIAALGRRAEVEGDVGRKVQLLHRIAHLWADTLGNQGQAIAPLEAVLRVAPDDEDALARLCEIHEKRRNWQGLFEVLQIKAQQRGDQRIGVLQQMAALAGSRLGDLEGAVSLWDQVAKETTDCADSAYLGALEALGGLYQRLERWPELATVLKQRRVATGDAEQRQVLLQELADLYSSRLGQDDQAIAAWEDLLEECENHPKAVAVLRELYARQCRWEELERLLGARGMYADLAEALTAAADRSRDTELKAMLYRRIGEICGDKLDNPDRALKAYERVLAVRPQDEAALRTLSTLYRGTERWSRLLATHETLVELIVEPAERLALIRDTCRLCEEQLGSRHLAFQWCARAFDVAPEDQETVGELERLAAAAGAWDELVAVYERRLGALDDETGRVSLLKRLAVICVDQLHRPEQAERYHQELLELNAEDEHAISALVQIYGTAQRWRDLVQVCQRQVDLAATSPEDAVETLQRIAKIEEERLGDLTAATKTYERIANRSSDPARAMRALERLYAVQSDWEALAETMGRRLALIADEELQVEILHGLAVLSQERLHDPDSAMNYLARALEIDPNHRPTLKSIESYLDDEQARRLRAAELLESHYERVGDHAALVRVLEIALAGESAVVRQDELRARLLVLYERRLEQPDRALMVAAQLLLGTPDSPELLREVVRLGEASGEYDRAAQALEESLSLAAGESSEAEDGLRWELARLLAGQLERAAEAEGHLRYLVAADPCNSEAFALLEQILRDRGDWRELREVLYARREAAEDTDQTRSLLQQIAALSEDVLEDEASAVTAYQQLLEFQTGDEEALRALERLYRSTARWQDLERLYQTRLTSADTAEKQQRNLLKQAEVRLRRLADAAGALELLTQVLDVDPVSEDATSLLEELLELGQHCERVVQLLEGCYRRRSQWTKVVGVLQRRFDSDPDPAARVALLLETATLQQEELGDPRGAFGSLVRALELAPADSQVFAALDGSVERLGLWEEAAEAYAGVAAGLGEDDSATRERLQLRLAQIQREELERPDAAVATLEIVLGQGPSSAQVGLAVTQALAVAYERQERWEDLASVLRGQIDWTEAAQSRCELLTRTAELEEDQLGRLREAAECHEEVRRLDAARPGVLDALERLYVKLQAWDGLVAVLRSRLEQPAESQTRRQIWSRLADLQENALEDIQATAEVHRSVLSEFPQDAESLRALARIFRSTEAWEDLGQVLREQLRLSTDGSEEQDALRLQLAEVDGQHLGDSTSAVQGYRLLLQRPAGRDAARRALETFVEQPDQLTAASDALLPVYREEQNWEGVIRIHELQAEQATGSDRVLLLETIAELSEQQLGDPRRAYAALDRAARAAVSSARLLAIVEAQQRVCASVDLWQEHVATLEAVAEDVQDEVVRARLYEDAARISGERLGDRTRAIARYRDLRGLAPDRTDVLSTLEGLYEKEGRWEDVLEVLAQQALAGADVATRVTALVKAGRVYRDQLGQLAEAIEQFEQAHGLDSDRMEAAESLEQLYEQVGRWDSLAAVLRQRAAGLDDPQQRAELYRKLARVLGDGLEDYAGQLQAFRGLLRVSPDEPHAMETIESLLGRPELRDEAADTLEPLYVARQQWGKVVSLYERRLQGAEDLQARHDLTLRIAQLREEQLEDLEGALEWYGRVFLVRPEDDGVREQLLRLGGVLDRWELVAELFDSYLHRSDMENVTARQIALALGAIYGDRLFRWQSAQQCFERILERRPDDLDAFEQLERLLLRYEKWQALLELYRRGVQRAAAPQDKRRLLLDMARVHEHSLGDLPGAIEIYQDLLDVTDGESVAAEALERLYQQAERWGDLCQLLQRQLGAVEDEEAQVDLRFRLAGVYEERLKDATSAVDYYEDVLRRAPEHSGAVAALERLLLDRSLRFRITQILAGIYRAQDQWAKLIVIHEAELDFVDDSERRVHILREIARLHEDRGQASGFAFDAMCRAAREGQQREETEPILAEAERLAEDLDRWVDVVELLEAMAENTYDPSYRVTLLSKMARVQEERLGDLEQATVSWNRVLAHSEDDQAAIEALQRLLAEQQQYGRLVEVLTRRAEATGDKAIQIDSYSQVARLNEGQLADPQRAVEAWQQVLALDEQYAEALESLCRLYDQLENWHELIATKHRRLLLVDDDGIWRKLQLEICETYEQRLDDRFEAIAVLRTMLQRCADDGVLLDRLDRLYEAEGLWSDLLEIVELKAATQQQDAAVQVELTFRAGHILANGVGDVDGAVDRFEQVAEQSPEYEPVRRALEGLLDDPTQRERVAGILQGVYQKLADIPALTRVLEAQVAAVGDALQRRDLLVSIAQIHEKQLEDSHRAFELYGRALGEDPSSDAVQANLERLAGAAGLERDLVSLYERHLQEVLDGDARRGLHLKVAKMIEVQDPETPDRAVNHYWAALEFQGDEADALEPLDRILSRTERWAELVDVLDRRRAASSDPMEQAELCFRVGEIRLLQSDGRDSAFGAFREALELNPHNENALAAVQAFTDDETSRVAALELLEAVFEQRGDPKAQAALWEKRLAILTGAVERAALWERLARLHEEQLNAPKAALTAMGRALAEDPSTSGLVEELERLAAQTDGFGEAVEVADALLGRPDLADDTRLRLTLHSARWHADRLGDMRRARQRYAEVLNLDDSSDEAFEALQQICRRDGDTQGLAGLLEQRARVETSESASARIWAELARLQETGLSRPEAAIDAWERVREVTRYDAEAMGELGRLYQAHERWRSYAEILDDQAGGAGSHDGWLTLKHRRAEVLLDKLEDADGAAETLREILDVAPRDESAIGQLERIHRAREDWHTVRDLLVQQLETVTGPARVEVFKQLADVSETNLKDLDDAVGYYQQIRLVEPADQDALVSLEGLLRRQGKWHDLIDAKRRRVTELAEAGEPTEAIGQLLEIARIWADDLESPDAAAEVVEEALERSPQDTDALIELARLYQLGQQWELSLGTLQRAQNLAATDVQSAELHYLRGSALAAQGASDDDLVDVYRQALDKNPDHQASAIQMETLARKDADWPTVAEMLETRVRSADRAQRVTLLQELGAIYGERLQRLDASVRAWERARHLDPGDRVIARCLAEAYWVAERLDEAEPLACELIEQWGGRRNKEVAGCHHLLGSIAEKRRDSEAALGHYEKAHRIDGTAGPTLAALGRLYMASGNLESARRIYRSMLLQSPQPDWGVSRAGVFAQLGRIHAALGEKAKARTMFERGLEVDPDDRALQEAVSELDQDD